MDQDLGVWKRHPLARRAAGEEEGAHAHRDAHADCLDRRFYVLHRVVDREARVDASAGGVDVQADVLVRVLGLEVDQLGHDQVRDVLVDRRAEEHDSLVQQAGVDVERALAAGGLLDDHGDQWTHVTFLAPAARRSLLWSVPSDFGPRAERIATAFWPAFRFACGPSARIRGRSARASGGAAPAVGATGPRAVSSAMPLRFLPAQAGCRP